MKSDYTIPSIDYKCKQCNAIFKIAKVQLQTIRGKNQNHYCSRACQNNSQIKSLNVICKQCNKPFIKKACQIRKSKNNFCNKSCSAIYNNAHKTHGTRRSKLEIYLEEVLTKKYSNLIILYNNKTIINSELDVYIPALSLAFELNGIFHYEPIYGKEKLQQIQNNDDRKFQACLENGIEFVIIDVSSITYWKPEKGKKYLNIINDIVKIKSEYGTVTQNR